MAIRPVSSMLDTSNGAPEEANCSSTARRAPCQAVDGPRGNEQRHADATAARSASAGTGCAGPGSPDTWLVNATIMPWPRDGASGALVVGYGNRGIRAASAR